MTSDARKGRTGPQGSDRRTKPARDLAILDPGLDDPGYWTRFRILVMARADAELSRRRRAAESGVTHFVQSWSRAVLPAAAIAAAIAGVLILRGQPTTAWGVEEALTVGLDDTTLPDLMEQPEGVDPFLLVDVTF